MSRCSEGRPKVDTDAITAERLGRWRRLLERDHATPLVLVAIGHDHAKGAISLCVPDDPTITNRVVAGFLRRAILELGERLDPLGADPRR
jgi:hypothetical protein